MDAVAIFITGLVIGMGAGVGLVRYGMGLGIRITDRLRHDQTPFEDMDEEELTQTHTDGTIIEE